ncbi:MAG: metallophosphoesterase [Verrucomicrobiales bacterium]|nr:metallophosphoesterase [Verrucomicrobiales bacterium]
MKLLLTSDLHQWIEKWVDLVELIEREQPRFVLIAGDLLPKEGHLKQKDFFSVLRRHLQRMRKVGPVTVLTYLGNDDHHILEPLLDALEKDGFCINLNGRVHREEGLVFCGMNKVRDYPFGYKHWCAPDGGYIKCPEQFCGEGLTLNEYGEYVRLDDLSAYLSRKPSLGMELDTLTQRLRPGEMARSIWMVHQPPSSLGMDILGDGQQVGSPTVLKFIQENQPLLGCSGHIHESPYQSKGRWMAQMGRTSWFQPGQIGQRLHAVVANLSDTLRVTGVRHTIFGEA